MDFWATWCGPCIRELPDLQALTERLKARRDVAFLSFNVTEEKPDVLAFVKEGGIAYPVYLADDLIGPYDVSAFPTKLVIDMRGKGEGMVRFRRDGYTEARASRRASRSCSRRARRRPKVRRRTHAKRGGRTHGRAREDGLDAPLLPGVKGLKHPVEVLANSVLSSAILYIGVGLGAATAASPAPKAFYEPRPGSKDGGLPRVIATPCDGRVAP